MKQKFLKIVCVIVLIMICILLFRDRTEIVVTSFVSEQNTEHTAFMNGKYYYYDKSENGIICEDKTVKRVFCLSDEPVSMSVNSKYIYILTDDSICQYNLNGEMIAELQAKHWEDIYASETYLYGNEVECIRILPADNISEPIVLDEDCLEFHKIAEYVEKEGESFRNIFYGYWDMGNEWVVVKSYPESKYIYPIIEQYENGYKVYEEASLISKKTGNPLLKFANNLIYCDERSIVEGEIWGDGNVYLHKVIDGYRVDYVEEIDIEVPYGKGTILVDDDVLCISGSKFGGMYLPIGSYSLEANGPVYQHKGEEIWYIDIQKEEVIYNYNFLKGHKVIYVDCEKYVVYNDKRVEICNAKSGRVLNTLKLDSIKRGERYLVELCGERLFFYHEGEPVESVDLMEMAE